MKAVWKRIRAWLDDNAPEGYGSLRPGASARALQRAEETRGLTLPDDVKASYRIHDGQDSEPGLIGGEGWLLLPLEDVVEQWLRWFQPDPKMAHRVPVAFIATGDYVFLDLGPKSKKPGRLIIQRTDSTRPDPLAPSFAAQRCPKAVILRA